MELGATDAYVAGMSLLIADLRDGLPAQFAELRASAEAEGYLFLNRLASRWRDGAYDGDASATVLGAYDADMLIAVGAQTADEYDPHPNHRRIRHFYVLPETRRRGAGCALGEALTGEAFRIAPRLHLRATHALSLAFWDAMGFSRVDHPNRTHEKVRP
jgi:GNAT superfamily N-acetyltransferase